MKYLLSLILLISGCQVIENFLEDPNTPAMLEKTGETLKQLTPIATMTFPAVGLWLVCGSIGLVAAGKIIKKIQEKG